MAPDPRLEAFVRERAAKLDRLFDRLTGCRVSIEALHRQHKTGNIIECHIAMTVPGGEIAVSREPHKPKLKYADPDARTSIRDAFKAAERRIKDYKAKLQGDVKAHDFEVPGRIAQLLPLEDHGFLLTPTGTQLYFHRNSVMNKGFDALEEGMAVNLVEKMGDTGPIASKLWTAANGREDEAAAQSAIG